MRWVLAALCLAWSNSAFAQETWPRLEGGAGIAACEQALFLGRAAFASDMFTLDKRPSAPPPGADIVLSVSDSGPYGDEGIVADAGTFIVMPPDDSNGWGRFHWARRARHGLRLVVVDGEHSWRGYNYDAVAVPEATEPDALRPYPNADFPSFTEGTAWRVPIVLRDQTSDELSLISLNFGMLAPWAVFTQAGDRYAHSCTIRFRPDVERGDLLLPTAVRLLAQRIDDTLGEDGFGTLNPIGHIRGDLSQAWANVALRPWALNSEYVTPRPLTDESLRRWSRQAPSFRAAYEALLAQYPRAQRALEAHYRTRFHLSSAQAREVAAYALDFTLRSAYHFPGSSSQVVAATCPWPADAPRGQ